MVSAPVVEPSKFSRYASSVRGYSGDNHDHMRVTHVRIIVLMDNSNPDLNYRVRNRLLSYILIETSIRGFKT